MLVHVTQETGTHFTRFFVWEPVIPAENLNHTTTMMMDDHLWGRMDTRKPPTAMELRRNPDAMQRLYDTCVELICECVAGYDLWHYVEAHEDDSILGMQHGTIVVSNEHLGDLYVLARHHK